MYRLTYRPDLNTPQIIVEKDFDSYKSMLYFANKFQADGIVLKIEWFMKQA